MGLCFMRLEDRIVLDGAAAAVILAATSTPATDTGSSSGDTSSTDAKTTTDSDSSSKTASDGAQAADAQTATDSSSSTDATTTTDSASSTSDASADASAADSAADASDSSATGVSTAATTTTNSAATDATDDKTASPSTADASAGSVTVVGPDASDTDSSSSTTSEPSTQTSESSGAPSAESTSYDSSSDSSSGDGATSSVQSDQGASPPDTALAGNDADTASTPQDDASAAQTADADTALDNATTSDAASPSRVLVVASDVADAQGLADDVNADTVCVVYDASTATTTDVLDMVSQALDGTKAQSIAFATNGLGAGQMELTKDLTISLDTLDSDQNLQDFWQSIGSMVESDGRIDILACDAGAGTEGAAMASAIRDLSGVDVAASVNTTGDTDLGGDWTLETRNVDVATLYFDTTKLNTYTGTLDSAAAASAIAGSATTASTSAPTSAASGAVRVMAVSSAVANAQTLASDVADGVIALVYDAADTAEHVLQLITQALNGQQAESIAFASHENATGSFDLVDGQIVSLDTVMTDDALQDFWRGVGDLLTRDGSIDILACDQGAVTEGQLTVAAIAKASGHEAHASTDATGNETSGGDWVLELGDVDLTRTYFNAEKLANYGGVLGTSLELTAADGEAEDEYGFGVAIDGDTIVVGARGHDSGAVYIYYNDGSSWTFQAELTPTDGGSYDYFGQKVAIDGDTVVVGSPGHNAYTGAAYVYTRSATTWTLEQELTASDGVRAERFGTSVDIDGDTIIVGAYYHKVGDNIGQGAAYVFVRSASTWTETAELTASDGRARDYFGASVAIDGDTIVVGAYQHAVDDHTTQGAAYVFVGSGSTWTQQAKLLSDDGASADNFGIGVAIDGDTVVVGAYHHNVGDASNQGEAYVYTRTSETWSQQAKLTASDGKADASFGYSVAIDGEYVMVGANCMDGTKGAAYLYKRDAASSWIQIQELTSSVTASLGNSVAISEHVIIVGAPRLTIGDNSKVGALYVDDIPVTGITLDGAEADQALNDTGTIQPFAHFTIDDSSGDTTEQNLTVSLSSTANGGFTTLSGFTDNHDGTYSFTGTAAQAQTAIQGLVFTPTAHQVAPGLTVTTTFTVSDSDGTFSSSNNTTSVVATSLRDTPTFTGAVADQAVNDDATISPFTGFSVVDPDIGQTHTATVTLSDTANGALSNLGGGAYDADTGVYTVSGTLAQVNTAVQGLVFTPTAHQVAPGQTVTTTFTVTDTAADAHGSSSATPNSVTTVVATAMALPAPAPAGGGGSGGGGGSDSGESGESGGVSGPPVPAVSPPISQTQPPTHSETPVVTASTPTLDTTSTTSTGVVNNASTASGLNGTGLPSADSSAGTAGGNASQAATTPGMSQAQQLAPTGVADTTSYAVTSDQTLTIAPSGTVQHAVSVTAGTLGPSLPLLTVDAGLAGFGGLTVPGQTGSTLSGQTGSGQTGAGQSPVATGPASSQSGLAPAGTSGATADSSMTTQIEQTATILGGGDQVRTSHIKEAMTDVVQTISDIIGSQTDQAAALAEIERSVAEAAADKGVTDPAVIEGMRTAAVALYQQLREGNAR
ncbi:hypothetical protein JCM15519_30550 [Fundidesulfovibrio butyratiphilus]